LKENEKIKIYLGTIAVGGLTRLTFSYADFAKFCFQAYRERSLYGEMGSDQNYEATFQSK